MTSTYSHSALTTRSTGSTELKSILLEPLLVVGVSAFWLVTLPFAAVSMLGVNLWDTAVSFSRRHSHSNPLILRRRGLLKNDPVPSYRASAKRAGA